MKAFVTGIAGFAGSHLADLLLEEGFEVHGTLLEGDPAPNIAHCRHRLKVTECDIADTDALCAAITEAEPDCIFHLAALSFLPSAESGPQRAVNSNILGSVNVLDCVRRHCPDTRVIMISSSAVYGKVAVGELPVGETAHMKPESVYAITKTTQEYFTRLYHRQYNLHTINLRPFNHIGPRQSEDFVAATFAKQIAEIEQGKRENVIQVGDLSAERDFTDVRDMVRAYHLAYSRCRVDETYNICSGKTISIRGLLDILLGLAKLEVRVETDPARLRSGDLSILTGDCAKFKAATGWEQKVSLEESLSDILDYWRERV